jgi:hypothetical protein
MSNVSFEYNDVYVNLRYLIINVLCAVCSSKVEVLGRMIRNWCMSNPIDPAW